MNDDEKWTAIRTESYGGSGVTLWLPSYALEHLFARTVNDAVWDMLCLTKSNEE